MYRSALLLAILLQTAAAQAHGNDSLTIFLKAGAAVPTGVLNSIEKEVGEAFNSTGIQVLWHTDSQEFQASGRISVVRLHGACSPDAPLPAEIPATEIDGEPLGFAQVVNGNVLPFIEIRCDSVRTLMGDLPREAETNREKLLGRALARVLSHELYHVLLRTTEHSRSGLASRSFSRADLLARHRKFDEEDQQRLAESYRTTVAVNRVPKQQHPPTLSVNHSSSLLAPAQPTVMSLRPGL